MDRIGTWMEIHGSGTKEEGKKEESRMSREYDERRMFPKDARRRLNILFEEWIQTDLWQALTNLREKLERENENRT